MTYVVTEICVDEKDRSCIEDCPVDAIYEGPRGTYINPKECIDCGACVEACPVGAIFFEGQLPAQYKDYTEDNATFFVMHGIEEAGGYEKAGMQDKDAPLIEGYVEEHG